MNNNLLKVEVLGVGHLAHQHVIHFCSIDCINFLGLLDPISIQETAISTNFNAQAIHNIHNPINYDL